MKTLRMFENAHFINIGFDPEVAYNDLPLLPPSVTIETIPILKACVQARAALAELNQICRHFPDQDTLWQLFVTSEAQASAALDGVDQPLEVLLQHSPDTVGDLRGRDKNTDAIKTVFNLKETLEHGYTLTRDGTLNVSTLLELCSRLEGEPMALRRGVPNETGTLPEDTPQYIPPVGVETIQKLLLNWEAFIELDAGNLDPLVLIAIAHYQMEAIAPFASSNSTLSRMLDNLLFSAEELLSVPVLGLSRWMRQNQKESTHLQSLVTRELQWEAWILHFINGVHVSAQMAIKKVNALEHLYWHTDKYIEIKLPKIYSRELLGVIFEHPYSRIHNLVDQDIAKRQTASVYLKQLCDLGVLRVFPFGKEKLFAHQKLLQLLAEGDIQLSDYRV